MKRAIPLLLFLTLACASGPPQPAALSLGNDACSHCRMVVSDAHFAAQLVAPGEEPRFFDDIGCLAGYLKTNPASPSAVTYVADHHTGEWVNAKFAIYTRVDSLETPMGSHVIAHLGARSRDADPVTAKGVAQTYDDVFGD
jgi:copper chaperone NosL